MRRRAVWAVNKPGRDARRLDHGKSKERGGAGPPSGVSAVRGGPWPDVPGMLPYALWCFNIVGARRGAREILTLGDNLGDHRQTIGLP